MIRLPFLVPLFLIVACAANPAPEPLSEGRWIDLTHTLGEDSVFWPTIDAFRHDEVFEGETPRGYYYSAYNIFTSEHGGTHLDAPIHFARGRQTADEVPLESLIGPGAVIDVSERALADRDYLFTVEDLVEWEADHGRLPDRAIVLVRTGYDRFWPDAELYMGTDIRGPSAFEHLHFPGFSPELARFLVEQRNVRAVGLDTPSLDYGQSRNYLAHQIFLGANVPGFENVTGLDRLPATGATIVALPAKIRGGSGAPLRIVAHLPSGY